VTLLETGKLEPILIELLAEQPRLSAYRLQTMARRRGKKFSQAAVYKELGKLLERGVVVKDGIHFSLSLAWILDVFSFSDQLTETYFTESYLRTILPDTGERQRWRFNTLVRCNDFWNQLLLALLKSSRTQYVLSWVPHPWFLLLSSEQETRLQRAFTVSGRKFYTIFGGTSSRRGLIKRFYTTKSQEYSFADSPLDDEQTYLDVVGDYVLSVRIDPRTNDRIKEFFEASEGGAMDRVVDNFRNLLGRCNATIRIEHDQRKARQLQRVFADYFGLRKKR
jgi:hypothetical protein